MADPAVRKYNAEYLAWLEIPEFCACGCGKRIDKGSTAYNTFAMSIRSYGRSPRVLRGHGVKAGAGRPIGRKNCAERGYKLDLGVYGATPLPENCAPTKGRGTRQTGCKNYSAALDHAIIKRWSVWHCGGCAQPLKQPAMEKTSCKT
jgi:hypothetical protein